MGREGGGGGRGLFGTNGSNMELDRCNLVEMLLDIVMPEIRSINTIAFQTKVECQGLLRLIIFGSPFTKIWCENRKKIGVGTR